jgi:branched-chain amino acid transport system permease protein
MAEAAAALAASLGIGVTRNKVTAFVVSSMLAALAGAVYAPFAGFISPDMMSTGESVTMVGMLIVGGIGTMSGPIVGTLIFFALPEFLRVAKFYRLVILGAVIVLTVLFLPEGVVSLVKRRSRDRR